MADSILLQVSIGGMSASGTGVTLFGELDRASSVLLIDLYRDIRPGEAPKRAPGCAVLTNDPMSDDHDLLFTEDALRQAISDYYTFVGRDLLVLEPKVSRFNPQSAIEADGIDERGRKYRFAPGITNGQVAVVAMCWFALQQSAFASQVAALDDYADLSITSVGIHPAAGNPKTMGYAMGGKLAIGADGWPV